MPTPFPTPIYRIVHIANLEVFLRRGGLYSPNAEPKDGLVVRTIHSTSVQASRHNHVVPCGTGGTCHDYVPFYFGRKSVMLLQLKTDRVDGYTEGQAPIIYLKLTAQSVEANRHDFVFTDGHGLAYYTSWFDDLKDLDQVDWGMVNQTYWADNAADGDRKRRKQAEFLIKNFVPWELVEEIVVLNQNVKAKVLRMLEAYPHVHQPTVHVDPTWYYS